MSRLGARLLMISGIVIVFVGYFILRSHSLTDVVHLLMAAVVALVGAVLFGLGTRTLRNVRMDTAATASDAMANDSRAPVLYLRSFKQDPAAAKVGQWGTRSDEEQMSGVLQHIGPVVAVGDPKERRVTLGANRIYLRDDEWQDWVRSQMRAAALVIFRASDTDAFWWEVATAAEHVPLVKAVYLLPSDPRVYDDFRLRFAGHFTQPLPPRLPRLSPPNTPVDLWGLMYFDEAGQPVFRSWLGGPKLFTTAGIKSYIRLTVEFRYTNRHQSQYLYLLRPLLARAGARTRPRPTLMGTAVLCCAGLPLIVPFLGVRLLARRIRGESTVTLPGWNESG